MTIQTPPDPTAAETAMHLPHAIMRFLREADPQHKANAHDLLAAFATDATVIDNEHSYTGHDEIHRWREAESSKYTYTVMSATSRSSTTPATSSPTAWRATSPAASSTSSTASPSPTTSSPDSRSLPDSATSNGGHFPVAPGLAADLIREARCCAAGLRNEFR